MNFPPNKLLRQLLNDELRQRAEEGCAVEAIQRQAASAGEDWETLLILYEQLAELAPRPDFPFQEPSDLPDIRVARPAARRRWEEQRVAINDKIADRIHGGWLGRCAGCALGKPLESPPFMKSAENVKKYLQIAGAYPLDDFVPQHAEAMKAVGLADMHSLASQRGHVRFMESDDDLRYTIMGLDILEKKGAAFSTRDVAAWWLWNLPAAKCFTAEEAAYRNLFLLGAVHDAQSLGDAELEQVRSWMNPYREWIGAQIRADGWGLACPGDPARAAEFAWRDAALSHVKNGIYGEMLCAAMIAAAAVLDDPLGIVQAGLNEIPQKSRLTDAIRRTIEFCRSLNFSAARFEDGIRWVWQNFGHYDPVHTINNAAAVVMALLLGGRDYEKVITTAVMCGLDPDCNGATAGCICGTMLGAKQLPKKWTAPLNDTLFSEIPGFHPIALSECARRHIAVARRLSQDQN